VRSEPPGESVSNPPVVLHRVQRGGRKVDEERGVDRANPEAVELPSIAIRLLDGIGNRRSIRRDGEVGDLGGWSTPAGCGDDTPLARLQLDHIELAAPRGVAGVLSKDVG